MLTKLLSVESVVPRKGPKEEVSRVRLSRGSETKELFETKEFIGERDPSLQREPLEKNLFDKCFGRVCYV